MSDLFIYETITWIIGIFVILTLLKNFLFLMIAPFYNISEKIRQIRLLKKFGSKKVLEYAPTVSIIIPAWNEEVGITKTVTSVMDNGYSNIEIVVVNDGSTDNTEKIMREFIKKIKKPEQRNKIKYISQKNGGKGRALNNGIQRAKGEIILTIDADSVLRKGSISNLVKYYLDESIKAVVGNVQVSNTSNLVGLAQHIEYYFGFYNKRGHAVVGAEYIFGGACASFRKSTFEELGLFDTVNKTEDIEMSMRIRFHGYNCTYAEDVVCYTEGASTFRSLISQRVRWKKGRMDTFIKYRSMFFSTEDSHNAALSFFVLPFSLLAEIQLLFEPVAIAILVTYSIITAEYLSLAVGISFIFIVYLTTALFSNSKVRLDLILLFPFTWPLFYVIDWVEFMSLWKTIKMLLKKEEVIWQKWDRKGINPTIN